VRPTAILLLAAFSAQAAGIPMSLVSEDEAEPIRSAIHRKESWTQDEVRRLRKAADQRLKEGPWSVTTERPKGIELDPHDYYSEALYWWPDPANPGGPFVRREGQVNPSRFTANRNALSAMCDAVFTLGTAAYFLEDSRYEQRAARVIRTWFVNSKLRMNPSLEYAQAVPGVNTGRSSGIIDGRGLIRAVQGMEFLAQTGAWSQKDQAAVHKWFEEYLRWLTHSKAAEEEKASGNNHASWWAAQVAAIASFLGDEPARQMALQFYRDHIFPRQIRADGSAPREEARPNSLSNSVSNVEAYAVICRIAQVHGVDLWNLSTANKANLARVIDYLTPYLSEPKKWSKDQIEALQAEGFYSLAFAGMGLRRPDYIALYRKLERPEGAWSSMVDLLVSRWEAAAHQTRH
jgi:hypothetical protein